MRERLLTDERGFTLPEMVTTILVMIVVLFALYSIFDMSLRVFSFGNNKVEAVESARIGLEKMEREIRGAYKYDSNAGQDHLFFAPSAPTTPMALPAGSPVSVSQLTFGNEINNTGTSAHKLDCPVGGTCEYITYKLTDDASSAACTASPCDLRRVNTANSGDPGVPVVENVALNGLTFILYTSNGTAPTDESQVRKVLVSLDVRVAPGTNYTATQELVTEIDLRNRS